ncbi:MAG: Gfo/Idh/MocA family oxidoreductase, partial [Pseudomonadota bacterium]|nr:Gfo/Idh/MocA family oxidoreductase [Pseudomonadota bacterium]
MNAAAASCLTANETATLGVGIVGLGAAGRGFIPAILAHPGFELVAAADRVDELTAEMSAQHRVATYRTLDAMLDDPRVHVVYVATPTELHADHVERACASHRHVLVEKPMAVTLEEAARMVASAQSRGVVLVVGHSHSHDLPIRRMRELIRGGSLGAVRMVNTWCFTDWMYRPRRPEELEVDRGGGVTFRQGSHQFDILRLLCGGEARSIRASTFDWDPQRRSVGAHVAFLDFHGGAAATAVYNGYGHFSTMDLTFDVSEWGFAQTRGERPVQRVTAGVSPEAELAAKQARARHA